jgi:tRNA threonylcarbamoyladenosine biosynthesis protein TsaE
MLFKDIEFQSNSEQETAKFAADFVSEIDFGTSIALHGNLGCGKTVFARGFANGLGIKERISSPTFTIVQEYPLVDAKLFYHMDFYRIHDSEEAFAFGLDDFLSNPDAICVMEWAERVEDILDEETIHIEINRIDKDSRIFKIFRGGG